MEIRLNYREFKISPLHTKKRGTDLRKNDKIIPLVEVFAVHQYDVFAILYDSVPHG